MMILMMMLIYLEIHMRAIDLIDFVKKTLKTVKDNFKIK